MLTFPYIILTFLEVLLLYINYLLDMIMSLKNRGLALRFHEASLQLLSLLPGCCLG